MDIIEIQHPSCHARIALQGAQLLEWTPHGCDHSLLWCTPDQYFQPGRAIRGGVPICWPWFNKQGQPSHGFARTERWSLCAQETLSDRVIVTLELKDSEHTREIWPHPFHLRLTLSLGHECQIDLNIDCQAASTGALHTYLNVGDVQNTQVSGLGLEYFDSLTQQNIQIDSIDAPVLKINQAVDRIYTAPLPLSIVRSPLFPSAIEVEHQHHQEVVIWNPWQEGAQALSDMNTDDFQKMLCVETASISHPLDKQISMKLRLADDH